MQIRNKILSIIIITSISIISAEAANEDIQSLIKQGAYEKALVLVEKKLATDTNDIQVLFLKGLTLARMDRLKDAEAVFVKLTDEHPELPEPYNNLAVIYAASGNYDKAEEALRKAINTHPSYATAHENLGDIYAKMASQAYNNALKLDAGNKETKEKLAMISDLISAPEAVVDTKPSVPIQKTKPQPESTLSKFEPQPAVSTKISIEQEKAHKEIKTAVNNWVNAWSAKDVKKYVNSYSDKFIPPEGLNRSDWEAQRYLRLSKPKFIKVTLNDLKIEMLDKDSAMVRFVQAYQSDSYQDKVNKRLLMDNLNNVWLISKEEAY